MCIRVVDQRGAVLPTQTKRVKSRKKIQGDSLLAQEFERHRTLRIVAVISILALGMLILAGLFDQGWNIRLSRVPQSPLTRRYS